MAYGIIANGTVNRVFFEGKGISVKETFTKRDGTEGAAYYTAFFEEAPGLSEGAVGKFSGTLSSKAREHEGKHYADIVLNNTKFEAADAGDVPF